MVATIGGVAFVLHTRAQADEKLYPGLHGPVAVVCPGPPYGTVSQGPLQGRPYRPTGLPTIHPRTDCTPSFTQQDVRDYLAAHDVLISVDTQVVGRPTVTRVIFLTIGELGHAAQYSAGVGENFQLDMLVCYVELSGTFNTPPTSINAAYVIFDAHTGNELVWGLGPMLG